MRLTNRATLAPLLPAVYALLLFCVPLPQDRVLTVHEGVLPQTARAMYADGDWLVPRRAGAPWVENPPLPQWFTVGLCTVVGTCDEAWVSRLGTAIVGTLVVLMTAILAVRLFGPITGMLAGFVMATTYEIVRYATLAEDEIYLAALVTVAMTIFSYIEFPARPASRRGLARTLFGGRSFLLLAFFVALGATNLAKGLVFGAVLVLVPALLFVAGTRDSQRLARYCWIWGWLIVLLIGGVWPALVVALEPGAIELWIFDLLGRLSGDYTAINEPWWYYAAKFPEVLAPWILLVPFGLHATFHKAIHRRDSAERFLWVWAFSIPLVLTVPGGKHHHYLLPGIAPWVILGAWGLRSVWDRVKCSRWGGWRPAAAGFLLLGSVYGTSFSLHKGASHHDGVFLRTVRDLIGESTLAFDMSIGGLSAFQMLFYLPTDAHALHNLSFLKDDRLPGEIYLITKLDRRARIETMGTWEVVAQSRRTGDAEDRDAPLTLFRLRYDTAAPRVTVGELVISPMQAMYREPGPHL